MAELDAAAAMTTTTMMEMGTGAPVAATVAVAAPNASAGASSNDDGNINNNSVSKLHEMVAKFRLPNPVFSDTQAEGPTNDPTFSVECTVTVPSNGTVFSGRGSARGKKSLAKQMAAAEVLRMVAAAGEGVDEGGGVVLEHAADFVGTAEEATGGNAIGRLMEMEARNEFRSGPEFHDLAREGSDHAPVFGVTVTVELPEDVVEVGGAGGGAGGAGGPLVVTRTGRAPTKKAAKRIAAEELCTALGLYRRLVPLMTGP
mmetsp:Transcript_24893/g.67234  ORF Transcript_24893/g.67234 Transcript_24893/m.67234 type:complete len:258 (+) Transcript_24893:344-1117(+)